MCMMSRSAHGCLVRDSEVTVTAGELRLSHRTPVCPAANVARAQILSTCYSYQAIKAPNFLTLDPPQILYGPYLVP